nr:GNAT family N-acetyltransferase [Thermoleophilaceae bacterium]
MMIELATSDEQIARTLPVMHQLRTHLDEACYVDRIKRQQAGGYHLAVLEEGALVRAIAGFRVLDQLVRGRVLYVDDLVTDEEARSRGFGDALIDWLVVRARALECTALELDSGVQRHGAHRFYLRKRMDITAYHFVLPLQGVR